MPRAARRAALKDWKDANGEMDLKADMAWGGYPMGGVMVMVHWVTSQVSFVARAYTHPMGPVPSWLACPWDKCASLKRGRGAAKCALKSRPQNCHFLSQARGPRGKFAKLRNLGPLARFWLIFGAIRM